MVKVRATAKFETTLDATTGKFRHLGEEWEVDEARAKLLLDNGYVTIVEEEKPEEPKDYIEELEKPKKRGRKKKV